MGLWLVQRIRTENGSLSFDELCAAAASAEIDSVIDCGDERFLSPENMSGEIRLSCRESAQKIPKTIGELARVAYQSLARCYAQTLTQLEQITRQSYPTIQIVGGGSQADFLNSLTAQATGRRVLAGPTEASAIGNIMAQMIAYGEFDSLAQARRVLAFSLGF
jgi:rhamnulokinase